MNRKVHRLTLIIIDILSLFLVFNVGLSTAAKVDARRINRSRTTQVRSKRSHPYRRTKQIQHRRSRRRYQLNRCFHLANLRRIKHYQIQHRHHRIQIEHQKIRHIKRVKASKRHVYSDVVYNHNYGFDENYNRDINTAGPFLNYRERAGNDRVRFNRFIYLRYTQKRRVHRYGDPQSMVILPDGHLYVLFNVSHGNGHINQILEYNIRNGRLFKVGHQFNGGHGQGLSYDYHTHRLWLCMNLYRYKKLPRGIIANDMLLSRIDQTTLKPYGRWVHIRFHRRLGDNLAYDNLGDYWNVSRSYRHHDKSAPFGSLQIYKGQNGKVRMVKDILHSPSACIQNLAYNPQTNRLYVVGNGVIMSFPASRIHQLNNREIRVSVMNHHSEFEDLSFWNHRAYLLVHPDWILRSNTLF